MVPAGRVFVVIFGAAEGLMVMVRVFVSFPAEFAALT
jgi:hypothetical protein